MKYVYALLLSAILLGSISAQKTITGTIYQKDTKIPVPYTYVYAENYEQEGVFADENGTFLLPIKDDSKKIFFSHIAFEERVLNLKEFSAKNITTVYLQENIQKLEEVVVRGHKNPNNDNVIKEMLRKFSNSFASYLSLSKSYLLDLGYYDNTCISYIESIGFLYTPKKSSIDEMIFLPYNSKVSDVCYDKAKKIKQFSTVEKTYSFSFFVNTLHSFHKKSPMKKSKAYTYSILSVDKNKMKVAFKTKKSKSFKCEGIINFDLKNNIVNSIDITSLFSSDDLKLIKKGRKPYREHTLKIGFKHFDNKIYYKNFEYNVHYNYLKTNKFSNYLYLTLLFDQPKLLKAPVYSNPLGNRFFSSFSVYKASLVRIYYDKEFWKGFSLFPKSLKLEKIENDLGGKKKLSQQFQKNNLAYAPTLDKLRFQKIDSLFKNKIDYHEMQNNKGKVIRLYDYIAKYKIVDSLTRPVIENINNQKEISWTK